MPLLAAVLLALVCAFPGVALAADIALDAAAWQPFTGTGTLANAADEVPGLGTVPVLTASTAQGTGFGFVQAGYSAKSYSARYVRAQVKSGGPFILYVRARGSNGQDYYLSYNSALQASAPGANNYLYYTLSADYPARYDLYQTYTLDVQRDLARLVPGVSLAWIRWIAARGPLNLGRLEVLTAVEYAATDDDGDLLTGAAEDAAGTSPFLFDTDGDGVADGLEAQNACGAPLSATLPANLDADPDGDAIPTRTELYLGSPCGSPSAGSLPLGYGWEAYYPSTVWPAGASASLGADGSLVLSHAESSAVGFGVLSPPQRGRLRVAGNLNIGRDAVRFGVRSAENFYVFVRVLGSDGLSYYLVYSPAAGAPSYGSGYAAFPLGGLGYAFNGAAFTTVSRNLSADLNQVRPGVTVAKIQWLTVRGRLALRDVVFEDRSPPVFAGLVALPNPVGLKRTTALSFQVNEPLQGLPIVKVAGRSATYQSHAGLTYYYTYTTTGLETSGPALVEVQAYDWAGNPGSTLGLITLDLTPPAITAAAPVSAAVGGTVTLAGHHFWPAATGNTVTIGGIAAAIQSWSDTSITVTVPAGLAGGNADVVATTAGNLSNAYALGIKPAILALAPATAPAGHTVIISGTAFGAAIPAVGGVTIGGVNATILSWTSTQITVAVPTLAAGARAVAVNNNGLVSAPVSLQVVDTPYVLGVTPLGGTGGTQLTITGYGFGATANTVTLDGYPLSIVAWSTGTITAQIPNAVTAGTRSLKVYALTQVPGTVTNTYNSTDVPKAIPDAGTGYSVLTLPASGTVTEVDCSVNISQSGNWIGDLTVSLRHPDVTTVKLRETDGQGMSLVTTFDTLMSPVQPLSALNGKTTTGEWRLVILDRYSGYGTGTINGWSLIVKTSQPVTGNKASNAVPVAVAPTALALSPAAAAQGQAVTITGKNFGTATGTVRVNGAAVTVTGWSPSAVTFTTPALPLGDHAVTVTAGGVQSNALSLATRPAITSLTPARGPAGTLVTLTGTSFGAAQGASVVEAGGVGVPVASWSDTTVTFTADGLGAGAHTVVLTAAGRASNGVVFTVGARIDAVTPGAGSGGATLTLSGAGFGAAQGGAWVSLRGAPAGVVSWSDTSIQALVPDAVTAGTAMVTVVNGAGSASNGVAFVVLPKITGVSPAGGAAGAGVTVSGTNFGGAVTSITLGAAAQGGLSSAALQAMFTVGTGLTPGANTLRVYAGGLASNSASFTVYPSAVSLFAAAVTPGTNVQLTGANFGSATGTVTVGGTATAIMGWSGGLVTFKAPLAATAGTFATVLSAGGQSTSPLTLTIKPAINAVTPAAATAGTLITLTGRAFGSSQGASTLTIGGLAVTAEAWSPTSIALRIPDAVQPGLRDLALAVNGQAAATVSYSVLFSPKLDALSPASAVTGSTITMTGQFDLPVTVQTGYDHSCVTTAYGGLACWGSSEHGQVGDGADQTRSAPVVLAGLGASVRQVSSSNYHSCALSTAGGVSCWGYNYYGQVGDGSTTRRNAPSPVVGLGSGVAAISAGGYHSCAILPGGHLKCWGWNAYGQIGDNTTTQRPTPVSVSGMTSGVTKVWAGAYQTCALQSGTLKCWGFNANGEVGDGSYIYRYTPVNVNVPGTVVSVAPSNYFSCALNTAGSVYCWGKNDFGQLGDGTNFTRPSPTLVSGISTAVEIDTGAYHACARLASGALKCWGRNNFGELGDGTNTHRSAPVSVRGLELPLVQIQTGGQTTCAKLNNGAVRCWGANGAWQAATGNNVYYNLPATTTVPGQVYVGSARATVTQWGKTAVTFVAPNLPPGAYPVTAQVWNQVSNLKLFTVPQPIGLTAVAPDPAVGGELLTLTGTSFGASQGQVMVGGVPATVQTWSDTQIQALLPVTAPPGAQSVVVSVGGKTSNAVSLTVRPLLSSLTPNTLPAGAQVSATGAGFGALQAGGSVTVGGVTANVVSWSMQGVVFTVPVLEPGAHDVIITAAGEASNAIVIDIKPAITSITPTRGAPGTTVSIAGSGFGSSQGASTLKVGGQAAVAQGWSNTAVTFAVPASLSFGDYDVVVTVGALASNAVTFAVAPSLFSVSPAAGTGGDAVTLTGVALGASQGASTVRLAGTALVVQSWSDTQIVALVPSSSGAGVRIIDAVVGGTASSAVTFAVLPHVASLSPSTGSGGDTITIQGTNFGAVQGAVLFGGLSAAVVSWGALSIDATVPAGVPAGSRAVLVRAGGFDSNGVALQVMPKLISVNPATAPVGATITLTGANLGASSATGSIEINGVQAAVKSWSPTAVAVTVPAGVPAGAQPVQAVVNGNSSNLLWVNLAPFVASAVVGYGADATGVVLTGTLFGAAQGASQVFVGNEAVTVSTWTDTQIHAWTQNDIDGVQVYVVAGGVSSNEITLQARDVEPLFAAATGWNDYLLNDATDVTRLTGAVCDGNTSQYPYSRCIHGGALKSFRVVGRNACAGITAKDDLDAFTWICDASVNPVRVVSTGLQPGSGLKRLIDFNAPGWRSNRVSVMVDSVTVATSRPRTWWPTPVTSSFANTITQPGIVAVTQVRMGPIALTASKIAIVTAPGVTLNGNGTIANVVQAAVNTSYQWIEADFDCWGTDFGAEVLASYSRVHGTTVHGATGAYGDTAAGVKIAGKNNLVTSLRAFSNTTGLLFFSNSAAGSGAEGVLSDGNAYGVYFAQTQNVALRNARIANSSTIGMITWTQISKLTLSDIVLHSNRIGMDLYAIRDSTIHNVIAVNNDLRGMMLQGNYTTLINVTAANNGGEGVVLQKQQTDSVSPGNYVLMNVASINNSEQAFDVQDVNGNKFVNTAASNSAEVLFMYASENNYFGGRLLIGNNATGTCTVFGTSPGITNGTCVPSGTSDAVLTTGTSAQSSFAGKITQDDPVNPYDISGAMSTPVEWLLFANPYRAWGVEGSAFPNADNRGRCTSACRMWDWSSRATDTTLRGVLAQPGGNDTLIQWRSDSTYTRMLRNAVEVMRDGIGNENYLCESNETCLYTPNIGAYQGHGEPEYLATIGQGGTLENIVLVAHPENGY